MLVEGITANSSHPPAMRLGIPDHDPPSFGLSPSAIDIPIAALCTQQLPPKHETSSTPPTNCLTSRLYGISPILGSDESQDSDRMSLDKAESVKMSQVGNGMPPEQQT
jgi:hypothetical protein